MHSLKHALYLVLALVFGQAPSAQADEAAKFYAGQQVKIIIGYPPSSGHNHYAHILSAHIRSHMVGNPVFLPQNMPGAGSMVAANWLYNVAPRDGSTIGIFAINVLIDDLFGGSGAKFDPKNFNWVGNMAQTIAFCGVWRTSKVKSFEQLLRDEVLFGVTGPAGGTYQSAVALKNLFGAKIKLVRGYKAGEDIALAMERDEVQGRCGYPLSVAAERVKSGDLIPLVHDSITAVPELPGIPSVYDFARSDEDRQVLDLVFGWHILGRPVAAPPSVPSDRLKALQAAFMKTMVDPNFFADAKKSDLEIAPTSGPETASLVARFLAVPKKTIDRAAEVVRE